MNWIFTCGKVYMILWIQGMVVKNTIPSSFVHHIEIDKKYWIEVGKGHMRNTYGLVNKQSQVIWNESFWNKPKITVWMCSQRRIKILNFLRGLTKSKKLGFLLLTFYIYFIWEKLEGKQVWCLVIHGTFCSFVRTIPFGFFCLEKPKYLFFHILCGACGDGDLTGMWFGS